MISMILIGARLSALCTLVKNSLFVVTSKYYQINYFRSTVTESMSGTHLKFAKCIETKTIST